MGRRCSICTHDRRAEIDEALAVGGKYRDIAERYAVTLAAIGRHAGKHLPLYLARAADAAEVAAADVLLERLVDAEMRLTKLFHDAADAGDWRGATGTVREIVRLTELQARVNDAIPHPPGPAAQPLFAWPDGIVRPVVPLESEAELAAAGGSVTPAHDTPSAPTTPAPVAGAGVPDADDWVPADEYDEDEI